MTPSELLILTALAEDMKVIKYILLGNGGPGLKHQVDDNTENISKMQGAIGLISVVGVIVGIAVAIFK